MYDLAGPVRVAAHPGYLSHVFVDTDTNFNTISDELVASRLVEEKKFIKGPETGVRINFVGDQNLMISGDKVKMEVDVATNMEIETSVQDFLIFENDGSLLAYIVGRGFCGDSVPIVNNDIFGTKLSNPLESTKNKAISVFSTLIFRTKFR